MITTYTIIHNITLGAILTMKLIRIENKYSTDYEIHILHHHNKDNIIYGSNFKDCVKGIKNIIIKHKNIVRF